MCLSTRTPEPRSGKEYLLCTTFRPQSIHLLPWRIQPPRLPPHLSRPNTLRTLRSSVPSRFLPKKYITPPTILNTPPGTTIKPLSLADFRRDLERKEYKLGTYSGWHLEAYTLYLSRFGEGTVGGFLLVLDWRARDDRRELCGLPHSDPLTTEITTVLRYLVQYIVSKKDKAYRAVAEQNLSSVILMLKFLHGQRFGADG